MLFLRHVGSVFGRDGATLAAVAGSDGNLLILEVASVPPDFSGRRIRRDSPWQAGARISRSWSIKGLFVIRVADLAVVPKRVIKWGSDIPRVRPLYFSSPNAGETESRPAKQAVSRFIDTAKSSLVA